MMLITYSTVSENTTSTQLTGREKTTAVSQWTGTLRTDTWIYPFQNMSPTVWNLYATLQKNPRNYPHMNMPHPIRTEGNTAIFHSSGHVSTPNNGWTWTYPCQNMSPTVWNAYATLQKNPRNYPHMNMPHPIRTEGNTAIFHSSGHVSTPNNGWNKADPINHRLVPVLRKVDRLHNPSITQQHRQCTSTTNHKNKTKG